jgi:hypothetical protein
MQKRPRVVQTRRRLDRTSKDLFGKFKTKRVRLRSSAVSVFCR